MQQYFVNYNSSDTNIFKINGNDHHHITRVMRMKEGDELICVTKDAKAFYTIITKITPDYVEVQTKGEVQINRELPIQITVVSGIPKGDKLELVVQKGTELGASKFIPLKADRSISKWNNKKSQRQTERLRKIAKEAAEQSSRLVIPEVAEQVTLAELINISEDYDKKIVAFEETATRSNAELVETFSNAIPGEKLLCVFGPEGGLSNKEIATLTENDFVACSLGPRILRTETAPLYLLSAASFYFELLA